MQSPKVRAFVDFLVERLSFDADYMQVLCPDAAARCAAAGDPCAVSAEVAAEIAQAVDRHREAPAPAPAEVPEAV